MSSTRFKPIQQIAEKKERDSAALFGKALQQRESAQRRLNELEQFHAEYVARYQQASQMGITAVRVREYQVFIDRLVQAIDQQKQVLSRSQYQVDNSKQHWQGHYTKARAVDHVVERMQQDELRQSEAREQKDTDERNQRRR